jgi:predicted nuclease of predicted toxin-antitoxin system
VKFLLDVCVSSRSLTAFLLAQGHEVLSAVDVDPHASDEQIMDLARQEDRVLITADKDFGELVFVRDRPHGPLIRVVELSVVEQVQAVTELLDRHYHELTGQVIVTITRGRIRIRRRTR